MGITMQNIHSLGKEELEILKKRIQGKVKELRSYVPKVGIFGVTGVGKSSLCNALFGSDAAAISDVAACAREPQEIFIGNEDKQQGIYLVDVPGVGETIERDEEYFELYRKLMPELDLVLWVIKADDRAYAVAEKVYKEIVRPHKERCPTLFVINQVDKVEPIREWNVKEGLPGERQQANILKKIDEISKAFEISTRYIATVSAEEKYNLEQLMDSIVDVLPKEKKYAVLREATEEVKTEQAEEAAERGIWESIKEFATELGEAALEIAKTVVYENSPKLLKRLWDWLF
jgi:yeeP